MEPLKPTGFWSYTSQDDSSSRGRLSQLRRLLADELQGWIGRSPQVHIFQDVAAIPPGSEWEQQIHAAIEGASFFIPIVTPGFLQSEWCAREVLKFRERERLLNRDDLIFPIYYLDIEDFATIREREVSDPTVLRLLRSRQWVDFRDLRHSDPTSEEVAKRISRVSEGVHRALFRPSGAPTPPPPPPPPVPPVPDVHPAPFQGNPPADPLPTQPFRFVRARRRLLGWAAAAIALTCVVTFAVFDPMADLFTPRRSAPPAVTLAPPPSLVPMPVARSYLVFFDWDRSVITDRGRQILSEAADSWRALPPGTVVAVNGYDDTSQSQQAAMTISLARAKAVAAELERDGVPSSAIKIDAFGGTHLLVPTGPGVREPQNRRVEILLH